MKNGNHNFDEDHLPQSKTIILNKTQCR